jgi:hypothetical protein
MYGDNYSPTVIYIEHSSESQTDSDSGATLLQDGDIDILDDGDGLLINQNHLDDDFPHQDDEDELPGSKPNGNGNTISLSYEIESFRGKGSFKYVNPDCGRTIITTHTIQS